MSFWSNPYFSKVLVNCLWPMERFFQLMNCDMISIFQPYLTTLIVTFRLYNAYFCIFLARILLFNFVAFVVIANYLRLFTVFVCKLSAPICYFAYVTIIHVTYAYKINTIYLYKNEQAVRSFSNSLFHIIYDCFLFSFPRLEPYIPYKGL